MESNSDSFVRRRRRTFTDEFKAEAVRLCKLGDRSIAKVAKDLGISENGLRRWVDQARIDAGQGPPGALTTDERRELAELRRQNRVLLMEREILKKRRPSSRRRTSEVRVHPRGEGLLPRHGSLSRHGRLQKRIPRLEPKSPVGSASLRSTPRLRGRGRVRPKSTHLRIATHRRGVPRIRPPHRRQACRTTHAEQTNRRKATETLQGHHRFAASTAHRSQPRRKELRSNSSGPGLGQRRQGRPDLPGMASPGHPDGSLLPTNRRLRDQRRQRHQPRPVRPSQLACGSKVVSRTGASHRSRVAVRERRVPTAPRAARRRGEHEL